MHRNYNNTPNLIYVTRIYLSIYGIHLRDTDQSIITNLLQTLLHHTDNTLLLGRLPHTNMFPTPMPFNIHGGKSAHIIFSHRNVPHNPLTKVVVTVTTPPIIHHL